MSVYSERRYGRFRISRELVESDYEAVRVILSGCVVVQAETDFFSDAIEYTALLPDFDPVEDGQEVPLYLVEVTVRDGARSFRFVREKV